MILKTQDDTYQFEESEILMVFERNQHTINTQLLEEKHVETKNYVNYYEDQVLFTHRTIGKSYLYYKKPTYCDLL